MGNTYISVGTLVDTRKLSTISTCVEKKTDSSTHIRSGVTRCTQARFGKRVVEIDQDKGIDVPIGRIVSTAALQLKNKFKRYHLCVKYTVIWNMCRVGFNLTLKLINSSIDRLIITWTVGIGPVISHG